MTEIDMGKMCEGCLSYEKYPNRGVCLGHGLKDTDCPCINCLVKVMCSHACENYEESRNKKCYKDYQARGLMQCLKLKYQKSVKGVNV